MPKIASVPTIDEFRPVVLRVLNDGQAKPVKEIARLAAEYLKIPEEVTSQMLPSGNQSRVTNRVNWACSSFSFAGLVIRVKRGWYQITDDGRIVDSRNLSSYNKSEMMEWPQWKKYHKEITVRSALDKTAAASAAVLVSDEDTDPIELISAHVDQLNNATEIILRRKLQKASPTFFESVVVDLLWAMGYGGKHGSRERLGATGDRGIDGVIRQDALGLNKVYIQAKRYDDANTVQRPAIQQFYGSLASHGADRGVFITTASFSKGAQEEAERYKTITLIDGIRLTELMLAYGVGVRKTHDFTVFEVDKNFFDDDII